MTRKFNNKFYMLGIVFIFLICLSGCQIESVASHFGYTQKVVYDLGDGVYDPTLRNTHILEIYYKPGSYITDFDGNPNYVFKMPLKEGEEGVKYELEGWYFDKEFTDKVDFEQYTLPEDANVVTTIYAKWDAIFDKHFTIYYADENNNVLETTTNLKWEMNKAFYFDEKITHPNSLDGQQYTYIEAYQDEQMTKLVDSSYVLTKETDGLPIYTKWICGNYKVVNDSRGLQEYIRSCVRNIVSAPNLYLNADIDASELDLKNLYLKSLINKTILGNNHTIYNWSRSTFEGEKGIQTTAYVGGFVDTISECTIKDLNFVNASFEIDSVTADYLCFGALAGTIDNCTLENVNIQGSYFYTDNVINRLADENEKTKMYAVRIENEKLGYVVNNSNLTNCVVTLTKTEEE